MKFWFRLGISIGVLALLLMLLPWSEVRGAAERMPLLVWAGVLSGFLGGHALGTIKWRLLVNAGRSCLGRLDAVRCYAAGLFANLCLPSIVGGDVLRAVLAGKATGRPEAVVLGSVADRAIDIASLGILLVAGGLAVRDAVPDAGVRVLTLLPVLGAGGVLTLLGVATRRRLVAWPRRLRRPLGRGLVALRRLARRPGTAATALVLSLGIQGSFVLLNAWIGRSIGIVVPLGAWFVAWCLAKLAGLLPVSLGGLGVRDATLAALLAPFGVPVALGVVASLIWQSVLIAGGLASGAAWWGLGRATGAPGRLRPLAVSAQRR